MEYLYMITPGSREHTSLTSKIYLVFSPAVVVVAVAVSYVSVCSVSELADHQEGLLEGVVVELEEGDLLVGPKEKKRQTDEKLSNKSIDFNQIIETNSSFNHNRSRIIWFCETIRTLLNSAWNTRKSDKNVRKCINFGHKTNPCAI